MTKQAFDKIADGLQEATTMAKLLSRAKNAEASRDAARAVADALHDACEKMAAERDAAYRRGAEAMREAASKHVCTMRDAWAAGYGQRAGVAYAEAIRAELRALPIPEDKA